MPVKLVLGGVQRLKADTVRDLAPALADAVATDVKNLGRERRVKDGTCVRPGLRGPGPSSTGAEMLARSGRADLQECELLQRRQLGEPVVAQVKPREAVHSQKHSGTTGEAIPASAQSLQSRAAIQLSERLQLIIAQVDFLQRRILKLREQRQRT